MDLSDDENLSVDGVKQMVLAARDRLSADQPRAAQRVTPQVLSVFFRYVRNLCLMDRRLTPDLYTLVVAAKQTMGEAFALAVAETACEYPFTAAKGRSFRMGIDQAEVPDCGVGPAANRLPGQAFGWRSCELRPRPAKSEQKRWQQRWNPFTQCSYPPEDDRIESFQRHVRDRPRQSLGPIWRARRSLPRASWMAWTFVKHSATGTPAICMSR
jgi:hypothetical protein